MRPEHFLRREMVNDVLGWKGLTWEYLNRCAEQIHADYEIHEPRIRKIDPSAPSWDRRGLENLVKKAVREFESKTGIENLPYNLAWAGPYMGYLPKRKNFDNLSAVVKSARFAGWIKTAATLPRLTRLIEKTQSGRGVFSPYTALDLWKLAERHPSPHRLERFISKVRFRANQILNAYGIMVSWSGIATALVSGSHRVGKAARLAAALSVHRFMVGGSNTRRYGWRDFSWKPLEILAKARGLQEGMSHPLAVRCWAADRVSAGEFACIRDALAASGERLTADMTDGVYLLIDSGMGKTVHGISIRYGWNDEGECIALLSLGNKTYHMSTWYSQEVIVRNAIKSWKVQRDLEKREQNILQVLRRKDRTVLVYRGDSYRAGNCISGTAAFAKSKGFGDRQIVPAEWLIPHMGNAAVRRVLQVVAEAAGAVQ